MRFRGSSFARIAFIARVSIGTYSLRSLAAVNYCLIRQEVPCLLSYIDKFVDLSDRARLRRGHGTRVAAIIASIDSRDNSCRMRSCYRRIRGNKRRLNGDSPTISTTISRVRVSVPSALRNERKSWVGVRQSDKKTRGKSKRSRKIVLGLSNFY